MSVVREEMRKVSTRRGAGLTRWQNVAGETSTVTMDVPPEIRCGG